MTEPVGWYVVQPPTDGALAVTGKKATASITAAAPFFGPFAAATKAFSAQMNGHAPTAGPITATLAKLTASLTKEYLTGTVISSLKKATAAIIGDVPMSGLIASAEKPALFLGNATQTYEGQLAAALKKVDSLAFSGFQLQTGVAPIALKKLGMSSAGDHSAAAGTIAAAAKPDQFAGVGTGPSEITFNSAGLGGIDDTLRNSKTLTYGHSVVAGANKKLYVVCASGHSVWVNPSAFAITATCDSVAVAGTFSLIGTRLNYGNDSGNRLGHLAVYEYVGDPPVGAWSITVTSSVGSQGIHRMVANSVCVNNAGSTDLTSLVTQVATSTAAAVNLSLTPAAGEMAFFVATGSDSLSGVTWAPAVTPWYSGGTVRAGDLDFWDARLALGAGAAINYTTSATAKIAAIGFIIKKPT